MNGMVVAGLLASVGSIACAGAPEADRSSDQISIPGERVFPESLTSTADGTVIIGGAGSSIVYRGSAGAPSVQPWITREAGKFQTVLGVLAHEASNTLWVCSTFNPSPGTAPAPGARTELKSFDLQSAAPRGNYPFPDGGVCNDIAVADDQTVFVTDTVAARILSLVPGTEALSEWTRSEVFGTGEQLDGIAILDNDLIVNTLTDGKLYRIARGGDGKAGTIKQVQLPRKLGRPDGMRPSGADAVLIAEQAGRLIRIRLTGDAGEIDVLREGLNTPSGVTQVGNTAFVLESQIDLLRDPSKQGQVPEPFRAVAVVLRQVHKH